MSLILAVDTSTGSGSLALVRGRDLVAERTVGRAGPHASWLLPSIEAMLRDLGLGPQDIDLYALTTGPGSFTGLRIGVSTIKGLAWAADRPVAGVSTLEALAMNAAYAGEAVCPVLDARRSEVYAALYTMHGGLPEAVLEPASMSPTELVRRVGERLGPQQRVLFTGNGLVPYGAFFSEEIDGFEALDPMDWHVRATRVAMLARSPLARVCRAGGLSPLYLRRPEAELRRASAAAARSPGGPGTGAPNG